MFETVTKAKLETCFNFQEQNCQHQLVSRALASTGGEIHAIFTALKNKWLLFRAKDQYRNCVK